jgi:D-sedoheptulose 7-phosphate isomerase
MSRDYLDSIADHQSAIAGLLNVLASALDPAITMLEVALSAGGKVLLCGNGGSACDAQHLAAELVGRFYLDRPAYPAIALVSDAATVTAISNDYGYAKVFSRQVEAFGRSGDALIALSTSGRSKNVLEAIAAAKRLGVGTIGISGRQQLSCDVDIAVPSTNTARIQEATILCGHLIIEGLEARLPK